MVTEQIANLSAGNRRLGSNPSLSAKMGVSLSVGVSVRVGLGIFKFIECLILRNWKFTRNYVL